MNLITFYEEENVASSLVCRRISQYLQRKMSRLRNECIRHKLLSGHVGFISEVIIMDDFDEDEPYSIIKLSDIDQDLIYKPGEVSILSDKVACVLNEECTINDFYEELQDLLCLPDYLKNKAYIAESCIIKTYTPRQRKASLALRVVILSFKNIGLNLMVKINRKKEATSLLNS